MLDWLKRQISAWASDIPEGNGRAIHAADGQHHAVILDKLRVLIVQDKDGCWFAQSMDIDYAASGMSLQEAQQNFELGLIHTIKAHIKKFGHIQHLMRSPEPQDWIPLLQKEGCGDYEHTMITTHSLSENHDLEALPFKQIEFLSPCQDNLAA